MTPTDLEDLKARMRDVLLSLHDMADAMGDKARATIEGTGQGRGILENLPPPSVGGAQVESSLSRGWSELLRDRPPICKGVYDPKDAEKARKSYALLVAKRRLVNWHQEGLKTCKVIV